MSEGELQETIRSLAEVVQGKEELLKVRPRSLYGLVKEGEVFVFKQMTRDWEGGSWSFLRIISKD